MDPVAARQNLPAFCALMRRDAQVRLELARAARVAPDAPCPAPAGIEIRLGEEMTRTLERFVDRVVAEQLLPDDFDEGGQALPDGLAEALIAASGAATVTPARPLPTGAARARAQAARARAGMLHRALVQNDLDVVAPALDAALGAPGGVGEAEDRPVLARAALRVLVGVQVEESLRELGVRDLRPEDDPVLAAMSLPHATPSAVLRPRVELVTPAVEAPVSAPSEAQAQIPVAGACASQATEPATATPVARHSTAAKPASKDRTTEPALRPDAMFSAVIEHAIAATGTADKHGKTVRDLDVAGRLFAEFVGDRPMATLTWSDAAVFRDEVIRMPKLHGKSIYKQLTPTKAVELADALDERNREVVVAVLGERRADIALRSVPVVRMSKKTINKHISSLAGAVRRWYNANRGEGSQRKWTPFSGECFPKSETKKDVRVIRTALTDDEINRVFTSPRFTGHGDDRLRAISGPNVERDGRYWAPLIGLHGGLRLEEILQLQPNDVAVVQGIRVFCIGRRPDFRVKSPAARRLVPVHPLLIKLGLLDHVDNMRRRGERQLFPELERGGPDQRFGYAFSKDYTEYRRAIGAYEPGRDFHALRHSASTALFNAGADTSVVAAILGHEQVGVSAGVYLAGYKLAKLAEAIATLDFGLTEMLMAGGRG